MFEDLADEKGFVWLVASSFDSGLAIASVIWAGAGEDDVG